MLKIKTTVKPDKNIDSTIIMNILLLKLFFLKFLLMPLVALLFIVTLVLVKKKNAVIKNKTLIVYILIGAIIIAIPGLMGFASNVFSPYGYLFSQIFYLCIGIIHVNLLKKFFQDPKLSAAKTLLTELIITIICMLLGAYLYILIFDWISPYPGYTIMSATCIIIYALPLLFYYSYLQFINIPLDIYKTWQFKAGESAVNFQKLDYNKLMLLNVELTKNIEEGSRFSINAKAPDSISLGDWYQKLIEDYNFKYPQSSIKVIDNGQQPYSWIFYTKKSFFHFRRYLDFEKTISQNRLSDNGRPIRSA